MNELVLGDSGRLVPYGGDPWKLDQPDIPALADAAAQVLKHRQQFSAAARSHAEAALGLDKMMDGYLKALLEE
jgi:glycosyltransferase involved in cell wall biosynthesis